MAHLGTAVGCGVGALVGGSDGSSVGDGIGNAEGLSVGTADGKRDGMSVGVPDGMRVGQKLHVHILHGRNRFRIGMARCMARCMARWFDVDECLNEAIPHLGTAVDGASEQRGPINPSRQGRGVTPVGSAVYAPTCARVYYAHVYGVHVRVRGRNSPEYSRADVQTGVLKE